MARELPADAAALTRSRAIAPTVLVGAAAALGAAYLLTAAMRLRLDGAGWPAVAVLVAITALLVSRPFAGSTVVIAALPLFGNHPGGRFMELLGLGVAACTLGLCASALRRRRPLPGGPVWTAASLVVLSAGLALAPALPELRRWSWYVAWLPSIVTQTLTAAETVALYSAGSVIELLLAAGWAYALAWAGADRRFADRAVRCVGVALFAVMLAGALDFHHVFDLRRSVLARIDPEIDYLDRFQSVFWNPGWFAWYFTLAFGLTAGLLWSSSRRWRVAAAAGLAFSYAYFLTTSQRGGWVVIHVVLLVLALLLAGSLRPPRRRFAIAGLVLLAALVVLPIVFLRLDVLPDRWFQGLRRLVETPVDTNRRGLWATALRMWGSAPVFGIGEGAFGWRIREFAPAGSTLDVGLWGDAHNTWLQVLATRGLFGLAAFLALVLTLVHALVRAGDPAAGATRRSLVLGGVAFLAYSLVQHLFYLQSIQVLFWLMVAMVAITAAPADTGRPAPAVARWLAAAALVAALVVQVAGMLPAWRRAGAELASEPPGFYPSSVAERRWSSRRGTLCVRPTGPVMDLGVSTADPMAAVDPVVVTLSTADRTLDRFHVWRRRGLTRTVFLPAAPGGSTVADDRCGEGRLPLTVEVSRLWTPRSVGTLDGRLLGVNVVGPSFRALADGERIGLFPAPSSTSAETRAMGVRASLHLGTRATRVIWSVPIRSTMAAGRGVRVEAFWNERPAGALALADASWHELRVEVDGALPPGVLTLQASDVRRATEPPSPGALDFVSVEIGPVSSGAPPEGR